MLTGEIVQFRDGGAILSTELLNAQAQSVYEFPARLNMHIVVSADVGKPSRHVDKFVYSCCIHFLHLRFVGAMWAAVKKPP
jgi:hypothetical protein